MRKIDYEDIISLEGATIEASSCDIPYGREWRTLMDLYKWAIQQGFATVSQEDSSEAWI